MSEHLIVAGFHRGGTSLVCQVLKRAGLFLGYELLGATFSNPHGHFEDTEVMALHERILEDNGLDWRVGERFLPVVGDARWDEMRRIVERRDSERELWGFKDPRVCLFLPLWKYLLPNVRVLLVYRHFADSTYSLARRQATEMFSNMGSRSVLGRFWEEPDLALRMWLVHNEALLAFVRANPEDTLTVSLEMVREGFPLVEAMNRRWGLGLDDVSVSGVFDPSVTVERRGRQPVSDEALIPRVEETWRELERLGEHTRRVMGGAAVAGG